MSVYPSVNEASYGENVILPAAIQVLQLIFLCEFNNIPLKFLISRWSVPVMPRKKKGVVARNAFKLEFSELYIFFLFNGLNYIY